MKILLMHVINVILILDVWQMIQISFGFNWTSLLLMSIFLVALGTIIYDVIMFFKYKTYRYDLKVIMLKHLANATKIAILTYILVVEGLFARLDNALIPYALGVFVAGVLLASEIALKRSIAYDE